MSTTRLVSSLLVLGLVPACAPALEASEVSIPPTLRGSFHLDPSLPSPRMVPTNSAPLAPGTWTRPDVTPPTPRDCHEAAAIVVSEGVSRALSFAGAFDSWGATYIVTDASGAESTYFVAITGTDSAERPHVRVADGTRVVSYGYDLLLVGPSLTDASVELVSGWGSTVDWADDSVTWPAELAGARVLAAFGTPNRCGREATLLVETTEGARSVVTLQGLPITVARAVDVASTGTLGVSPTEVLDLTSAEGSGWARAHRHGAEGWSLVSETDLGAIEPLDAARAYSGWNIVGATGAGLELTTLGDDGALGTPVHLADDHGDVAIGFVVDAALVATGTRLVGLDHGTISVDEPLALSGAHIAQSGSQELAVLGTNDDGLVMRCFAWSSLRAPAP
jgi:hypothetical protein